MTILLRFRSGVYAALGDIKKMYDSVWLEDCKVHLHRFLWRDSETVNFPSFVHLEEECRVPQHDSHVTFSHPIMTSAS